MQKQKEILSFIPDSENNEPDNHERIESAHEIALYQAEYILSFYCLYGHEDAGYHYLLQNGYL